MNGKRVLRALLAGTGIVVALLLLLHGVENVRGNRAWAAWKAAREAAGDRFEIVVPSPVPEDANFAAVPFVAEAVRSRNAVPLFKDLTFGEELNRLGSWHEGQREDLSVWVRGMKAGSLEAALGPHQRRLDELAEASRRPQCRLPLDYQEGALPSLLEFRKAARLYRLRALNALSRGRSAEAREDVLTTLRIARHMASDPTLISALLQFAMVDLALHPVWEGLCDHRWKEADLAAFQEALGRVDLLGALARGWRHERMTMGEHLLSMGTPRALGEMALPGEGGRSFRTFTAWALFPRGWVAQNRLHYDRFWVDWMEPCLEPASHRWFPERTKAAGEAMQQLVVDARWKPYRILTALALPALMGQNLRAAARQTGADQALVACALERHRLARKAYPKTLADLQPGLLARIPVDVPAGGPLRYRKEGLGYVLYSLGADGQDDGGTLVTEKGKQKLEAGDWVWAVR